ncbi:hypothetical protein BpOF4_20669 (plasmid) [Alkalihalophilus pseudofirmus OF4]|uniref:Uncharacterized protein n=1 Tax=Alkalihalophilus pseudofirmus (strain ATCC BAA-2126 / JCM 17055 / OF4) TaxID=398511 RepID=D3G1A3_ALKPO|nr:hypothetical protein [Alkalihalophilus pseudofirmus]ADC52129.1 hypothetical protein BpOF4_20669 [Alkalihalophilus pseudofirmus OF4]
MFKIEGVKLQETVKELQTSASRLGLSDPKLIITSNKENKVTLFFNSEEVCIKRELHAEVTKEATISTTLREASLKASILPKEQTVGVIPDKGILQFCWGRSSHVKMQLITETEASFSVPEVTSWVEWGASHFQGLIAALFPFCAVSGSAPAKKSPVTMGINIFKDKKEIMVKATDGQTAIRVMPKDVDWFEKTTTSIPIRALLALTEVIDSKGIVKLGLNEDKSLLIVSSSNTVSVVRLLIGQYPNLDPAFVSTTDAGAIWTFDRLELLSLARSVSKLNGKEPILKLQKEGSKVFGLTVDGSLKQQIGAFGEGDNVNDFCINARNVEKAAILYRSEELIFTQRTNLAPMTVTSEEDESLEVMISLVKE